MQGLSVATTARQKWSLTGHPDPLIKVVFSAAHSVSAMSRLPLYKGGTAVVADQLARLRGRGRSDRPTDSAVTVGCDGSAVTGFPGVSPAPSATTWRRTEMTFLILELQPACSTQRKSISIFFLFFLELYGRNCNFGKMSERPTQAVYCIGCCELG